MEICNNFSLFPHNLTMWKCFCLIRSAASSCHNIDIPAATEVAVQSLVTPVWRSGICLVGFWSVQLTVKDLAHYYKTFSTWGSFLWPEFSRAVHWKLTRKETCGIPCTVYCHIKVEINEQMDHLNERSRSERGVLLLTPWLSAAPATVKPSQRKLLLLNLEFKALTMCWIRNRDGFSSVTLLFTYCDTLTFADRTAARRWERVGRPNWPFLMNADEARADPEVIRPLSSELIWIKINQEWNGFCLCSSWVMDLGAASNRSCEPGC